MDHKDEYELISHTHLADCTIFLVDVLYRPLHLHKELELCYVLDGSATISNNAETLSAAKGDLLLFDSGRAHEICSNEGGIRLLAVQLSKQICRRYCPQISNIRFMPCLITAYFSPWERSNFQETMLQTFGVYLSADLADLFSCMSGINHLLSMLVRHVPHQILSGDACAVRAKNEDRLHRVLQYLQAHFQDPIRLSDLAAMENLTTTYLSHFFKEHLHITFQEYLTRLRLEAAMYLLKSTNMTVTDIAYECGFSDPKYLNQSLSKQFHTTPQNWRKMGAQPERYIRKSSPYTLQHILTEVEVREQLPLLFCKD